MSTANGIRAGTVVPTQTVGDAVSLAVDRAPIPGREGLSAASERSAATGAAFHFS
jgi:hypothetical protein